MAPDGQQTTGWRERLRPLLDGLGGEPTVIVCGASALLVVSHYQGSAAFFRQLAGHTFDGHPWNGVLGHLWWFATSVAFYFLMPWLLAVATRGSFHERYGLQVGDWRAGLAISGLLLGVMLPATWVAAQLPSFKGMYPLAGQAAHSLQIAGGWRPSWAVFLVYELGYCAYFVGWEYLFRGWMVHGLASRWGRGPAILVQVAPFAVMHLGKAELEALGSIVAGVALALLSLRTRSFWYGALVHAVVAVWMDWLSSKDVLLGP